MKERIEEFLRAENKSSAQFAEEIGVQPSGISHILSGRNKPSLDFVMKMLEKYKFLSVEWLLYGKGSMYRDSNVQKLFDDSLFIDKQEVKSETAEKKKEYFDNPENNNSLFDENNGRRIERIVWFYSDNTFREFGSGNPS